MKKKYFLADKQKKFAIIQFLIIRQPYDTIGQYLRKNYEKKILSSHFPHICYLLYIIYKKKKLAFYFTPRFHNYMQINME